MQYLRTRRLLLLLAAIMIAVALAFAWFRNADDADSGLHLEQQEKDMSRTYGFSIQFGTDFDRAVDVLTRELKKQGFGIVSDINLQAIFKEKLAVDEGPYRILGVCNPWVAHQALRADPDIGLLLPCNVVVRQAKDELVTIAFTAPEALLGLVYRTDLVKLGMEIRQRLEKVRDALVEESKKAA